MNNVIRAYKTIIIGAIGSLAVATVFWAVLDKVYAQSIKGNQDGQREVSYIITDNDPLFCSGTRFLIIADKNGFNIICQNANVVAITASEKQTVILGNIFYIEHDALKFIAEHWDKINK